MLSSTKRKLLTPKRIAILSAFTAMSLIMFMIESLFPPLFLPGAKMGLSNIFSLLALLVLGWVDAIVVVLVRTTLGSIFTGNISTLMYSMTAGLASILVAIVLTALLYPNITVIAVSVVSAVVHNLTQNIVFCLVSNTPQMYVYMPWLAVLGVVAGIIVGFAVYFVARYVPLRVFDGITSIPDNIDTPNNADNTESNTIQNNSTQTEIAQISANNQQLETTIDTHQNTDSDNNGDAGINKDSNKN